MQADVLLVDDIQELAGKEAIQNELILIFNSFYESGKRFMMTSSQKEAGYGIQNRLVIREFWGDFAVITRAYIHTKFELDPEREEKRSALLKESERLYWNLAHDKEFSIESFKSYFKNVWTYFSQYIGLFDIDRPLPHHAGTSDCLEIEIDEFDNWFNRYCEGYKRTRTGKRISKIHWRLDL